MSIIKIDGVVIEADTLDGAQLATVEATMDTKVAAEAAARDAAIAAAVSLAWLYDALATDVVTEAIKATLALFQATPAAGTFGSAPEALNDNNTGVRAYATAVGQYDEVDFGQLVSIKRWRQYGVSTENDGSGVWSLQYYDLITEDWVDWVTGIATRALDSWSDFVTETAKLTTKIRLVCTTLDTHATGWSGIAELEVIY